MRISESKDRKNSESVGYTREIAVEFREKMVEYLHQGGRDKQYVDRIKKLTINDVLPNDPSKLTVYTNANNHGFHLVEAHVKEKYDLGLYRDNKKDIIKLLQLISGKESKSVMVAKACTLLARMVLRNAKAKNMDDENLMSKFDFLFQFAYGESEWRLKSAYWKENCVNSNADLTSDHRKELRNFDEILAEQTPVIDNEEKSEKEINKAKIAIKDAWDNTYRQARQDVLQYAPLLQG
ncbi:unnamed protein product [Bathycoccus prasinos]